MTAAPLNAVEIIVLCIIALTIATITYAIWLEHQWKDRP